MARSAWPGQRGGISTPSVCLRPRRYHKLRYSRGSPFPLLSTNALKTPPLPSQRIFIFFPPSSSMIVNSAAENALGTLGESILLVLKSMPYSWYLQEQYAGPVRLSLRYEVPLCHSNSNRHCSRSSKATEKSLPRVFHHG
jgi:hypothetical protein